MAENFVIKLGGSVISRRGELLFDFEYLNRLRKVLEPHFPLKRKFFITMGGGHLMRQYRDLAQANGLTREASLHWIGISVNNLHAQLARSFWYDIADLKICQDEDYLSEDLLIIGKNVKFGGGSRPVNSSDEIISGSGIELDASGELFGSGDFDALLAALKLNTNFIISLKNVDGVYSADPKKDNLAKRLEKITWDEYLDIIGNPSEHTPGANYPVDPVAAKVAKAKGISFYIMHGEDLDNLVNVLEGKKFSGTIISDNLEIK